MNKIFGYPVVECDSLSDMKIKWTLYVVYHVEPYEKHPDRYLIGVFDTKEKAIEIARKNDGSTIYEIEMNKVYDWFDDERAPEIDYD